MRTRGRGGRADAVTHALIKAAMLLTTWGALAVACTRAEPDAARHQVDIRAFQYHPARLLVAAGDTVVWINQDAVPHTATGGDRAWDTGHIPSAEAGQILVGGRGEHRYVCEFHPNMSGTLVVE